MLGLSVNRPTIASLKVYVPREKRLFRFSSESNLHDPENPWYEKGLQAPFKGVFICFVGTSLL